MTWQDRADAITVVTGMHPVRADQRYPLQSSIESELERLCWALGDGTRWEVRCSKVRGGGWVAMAVVLGPCWLRDATIAELEHGQVYRCVATNEQWTQAEAEQALLSLLMEVV